MAARPTKVTATGPARPTPERVERVQAPSGRWLEPDKVFTAAGKRGKFRFRALVLAAEPYIEAVDRTGKIRCIRPEAVLTVSNRPAATR